MKPTTGVLDAVERSGKKGGLRQSGLQPGYTPSRRQESLQGLPEDTDRHTHSGWDSVDGGRRKTLAADGESFDLPLERAHLQKHVEGIFSALTAWGPSFVSPLR